MAGTRSDGAEFRDGGYWVRVSSRSSSQQTSPQTSPQTAQRLLAQRLLAQRLLAQSSLEGDVLDQDALDKQLALAERRGADLLRAEIRDAVADGRRIVRLGEHQIEVIEVSVLADLIAVDLR